MAANHSFAQIFLHDFLFHKFRSIYQDYILPGECDQFLQERLCVWIYVSMEGR